MAYCLNTYELESILDHLQGEGAFKEKQLPKLMEESRQFQLELTCLTYLFGRILEKTSGNKGKAMRLIETLFSASDNYYLSIQECDEKFVEYLTSYSHERTPDETLEDLLIVVQNQLNQHNYERTLRY